MEKKQVLNTNSGQTPNSNANSNNKTLKKKTKKRTKLQVLKAEKNTVQKGLQATKLAILEDNERKANPNYTPYENRKKLARLAFDAVSKLHQVKGEINTKEKEIKQKVNKQLSTKIKKKFIKADKQFNRLIKMTSKLERIKMDEEALRSEITQDAKKGLEAVNTNNLHLGTLNSSDSEPSPLRLPRINSGPTKWIRLTARACAPEYNVVVREEASIPDSGGRNSTIHSHPEENRSVADKLAHKYEMTRELRNIIHQHMITRSYTVSYFNIIPPYKHFKPKPQKSKKTFNRLVLENKVGTAPLSNLQPKV